MNELNAIIIVNAKNAQESHKSFDFFASENNAIVTIRLVIIGIGYKKTRSEKKSINPHQSVLIGNDDQDSGL